MNIKVIAIVGATAVGKSDFAVQYAIKNNGEIISADSRQVYKGLDIGTGKITKEEMLGITHHLLDIASPKKNFNVELFRKLGEKAISDIYNRGKLPIICGGTGFYIDALLNNIKYPDVPHNIYLRKELKDKNREELFEILKSLDEKYAISLNNSEKYNASRLIRAIEISKALGTIPKINKNNSKYDIKWIKLELPKEELKKRIHNRLIKRMDQGMIDEVKKLHKNGLSWKRMEDLGLEYRYTSRYLRKLISKEQMLEKLETEIWHYAKRQILWFKDIKSI
ncbi:MAG: tRNA (adenosine(37)-N6)-dimethylallyltransferase MiaA [Patescibacteria group bacterium]